MLAKLKIVATCFFAALVCALSSSAQVTMSGRVIDVLDGKTVVIAIPSGRFEATLQYIEVPSSGMPMHDVVTQHLKKLVFGKEVIYRARTISYEASTGQVSLDGIDLSEQLLRDGAAWHIPERLSGQKPDEFARYAQHEAAAKNENRGIWAVKALKPYWDYGSEGSKSIIVQRPPTRAPGKWGDKNPKMGDVGALFNGYNAASKTGYLSTSLLGLVELGNSPWMDRNTAIDFTYFYREDDKAGRTGRFVFTILTAGNTWRFTGSTDLRFLGDPRSAVIAKAKRRTYVDGNNVKWEQLKYDIPRSAVERVVNGRDVLLTVGDGAIQPLTGLQLLLYNMLQLSR